MHIIGARLKNGLIETGQQSLVCLGGVSLVILYLQARVDYAWFLQAE